jgi:hypothetical protein
MNNAKATVRNEKMKLITTWHCTEILQGKESETTPREWLILAGCGLPHHRNGSAYPLIDEADTFLKENDELRGILNTGHRRGGQVTRTIGDDHEPRQFSTWAPVAIAMIGRLPDTLEDRAASQLPLPKRAVGRQHDGG